MATIGISEDIRTKSPTLFVRTRVIPDVRVATGNPGYDPPIASLLSQWAGTSENDLDEHPTLQIFRKMAVELGGDPAKQPPAVENLLRRMILRGRFPRINSVVDGANIVSIRHLIPIGIFDFEAIKGSIELAAADGSQSFVPVGQEKPVRIPAGTPALRDELGVFSAIGSRDSERTKIAERTTTVLAVSWGKEGIDPMAVESVLSECEAVILGREFPEGA